MVSVAGHAWSAGSGQSILLKRGVIDTAPGAPSVGLQGLALKFGLASGNETSDLYIVQFDGPVKKSWKDDIEAMGARLYSYIPENAFEARMPGNVVELVKSHDHVQYVGPFYNSFKIDPALDSLVPIDSGIGVKSHSMISGSYPTVELKIKVFDDRKVAPVLSELSGLGGTARVLSDREGLNKKFVYAEVPADKVYDTALSPDVEWVEQYSYVKLSNNNGRIIAGIDPVVNPVTPEGVNVDGLGQVAGILDSGLDSGDMNTLHNAFSSGTTNTKPKVSGTKSFRVDGSWNDYIGHGTHVAGTIAGYNPFFTEYDGVAAGASLYIQALQTIGSFIIMPRLQDVFSDALKHKAFVHNDSWGITSVVPSAYESNCVEVDTFTWEHPTFLPVFAAGNEGVDKIKDQYNNNPSIPAGPDGYVDEYSLTAPGTAKNVVTVGAAENYNSYNFQVDSSFTFSNTTSVWPREPIYSDYWNDTDLVAPYGVACFSSRGPTADNRIKPDIIAPGSYVKSALSQNVPPYNTNDYIEKIGTSMATPFVTGSAAVVREYLALLYGIKRPSAALVKAILINGAKDITPGQFGYGSVDATSGVTVRQEVYARPDVNQGWGLLDLENTLFPGKPRYMVCKDSGRRGTITGGDADYDFQIADQGQPVRVTLVWTDYPGSPLAAKALVNDLDLTVTSPDGGVYHGNAMADIDINARAPWLSSPYAADHTNNVEGVDFTPGTTGTLHVNIHGYSVPQSGRSGQPYALVVSGGLGGFNPDPLSDGFFSLSGTVINSITKLPSAGATVTVTGPVKDSVTTDGAGNFTVTGLMSGRYYISARGASGETPVRTLKKRLKKNLAGVKVLVH